MRIAARVMLLVVVCLTMNARAEDQKLLTRETKFLDLVYYDKAHEYLTYHLARSFENSLAFHRKLFNYTPTEPILILMQDFSDYGYGGTSTVPWNYISIGIEPFDYVYETMPANERMNWLMHHELVHVVATDKAAGSDLKFRRIFDGKVVPIQENPMSMFYSFLTSPRWYSPRWYHEGIAVFLETWMAGGVGRVLGGYDEMVFRTMVLDNAYFYDIVGLESEGTTVDFQVGQNSYLYGTRFVTWLAATYGPEKVIQWFDRSAGSRRYFSAQFKNVYGMPLDTAWQKWIASERLWQQANLAKIRRNPVTPAVSLVNEPLGSVSRTWFDPQRKVLYAAVNRPAKPAQIVSVDLTTGKITPLSDVGTPALYFVTSLAYDRESEKLFYTTDNSTGWRDLREVDLKTGRHRLLLKDCRVGDLVVNPADDSLWALQHHNGLTSIVRFEKPYKEWQTLLTIEYGRDIFDIDISPDGKTLSAAMIDVTGRQQLITFQTDKLRHQDSTFEKVYEFENNSPENFTFSPDGRYLYGTSYYSGVSNIFRYDLQEKKLEALTNGETGYFRPLVLPDNRLIAYRYTTKGFAPVMIPVKPIEDVNAIDYLGQQVVNRFPEVKDWNAGSPARVDLDKVTTYTGPYRASHFKVSSVYPVVEGYKDSAALGFRLNMGDRLGLNSLDLTLAYSPDTKLDSSERMHAKLGFARPPWTVQLGQNATDFYDLFGPTKTSRKGYFGSVSYKNYLIYEKPRTLTYTINAAHYGNLDTLPEYQNIHVTYDNYSSIGANLTYSNLRGTIGSVEPERGTAWSLVSSGRYVNSEMVPRVHATLDRGMLTGLGHTSLWLRGSAGKSFGDRTNEFGNFYFGGFGNNYVDYQSVSRYRQYYSFPGLELNEAGGNDFAKMTVELTTPPMRFRRIGAPALYGRWARVVFFGGGLVTDMTSSSFRQKYYDAGAQLDFSLIAFSNLDSTLSVGYAKAFHDSHDSDEVMLSLKLLK